MKYIKIFIFVGLILLTACGQVESNKVINGEEIFKKELNEIYSLYEEDKKALDTINAEVVTEIVDQINNDVVSSELKVEVGNIEQGLVRDGLQRVNGVKIPVKIGFEANEENVRKFLNKIIALDTRIIIGDILIDNKNENYILTVTLTFCGVNDSQKEESTEKGTLINVEENIGKTGEIEKIVLRDNDILMILRPYNSDSATVSLGCAGENNADSYIFYDLNKVIDVNMEIFKENNKYYCRYFDVNGESVKVEILPKSDGILFDVLSCEKVEKQDYVGVNLNIANNIDKKISIKIFDDADSRVSYNYTGNVEVIK